MALTSLELSETVVNIGSKVRVKWLDDWFEGTIADIAQQKDLYRVKESQTGFSVILHISQMKAIDKTRSTHEKFVLGAEIGYYDNSLAEWLSGTIEEINISAALMVKWTRKEGQGENLNFFEECDIAPIIENEFFEMEERDHYSEPHISTAILPQVNSAQSIEQVLDEKPVYRRNEVFDTTIDEENPLENHYFPDLENHLPDLEQFVKDSRQPLHPNKRRTSVSMKEFYAKRFQKAASKKAKTDGLHDYLENQHALLQGKLDHSALPAIWSYLHSTEKKGIPHHPASVFFHQNNLNLKRTQSSMMMLKLSRSPTVITRPESEPAAPYDERRRRNPLKQLMSKKMKKQTTDMSLRPLPPLPGNPYEVPLSLQKGGSSGSEIYDRVSLTKLGQQSKNRLAIKATSPKKQMVSAGGSVTLFCEVESSTPVTHEWYKDGQKLTHNDEQVAFPEPGKLQLYGLNLQSAGRYQCRVSNTAEQSETFECILRVENVTIHRSFSRELGLHRLAIEDPAPCEDTDETPDKPIKHKDLAKNTTSLPNLIDGEDVLQVPQHDIHPFSFLKSPSLMDLARERLDMDVKRLEEENRKRSAEDKVLHSTQTSKSTIDDRITHKGNRRRASNVVIGGMDNYLDGYGEDYGESANILDAPKPEKKKKTGRKKKKGSKEKRGDRPDKPHKKKKTKSTGKLEDRPAQEATTKEEEITPPIIKIEDVDETEHNNELLESGEFTVELPAIAIEPQDQNPPAEIDNEPSDVKGGALSETKQDMQHGYRVVTRVTVHDELSLSNDSTDVLPEYGSLTSVSSEIGFKSKEAAAYRQDAESKKGSSHVDLPLAVEHYTEGVKRLQESTQQYEEEHFGKEKNGNSRSLLNRIFKSNNSELN